MAFQNIQVLLSSCLKRLKDFKWRISEYTVKVARKEMTEANVVDFGHAAELYGCDEFIAESAQFFVKNDVPLTDEDMSPKLALTIVSILQYDNQKLIDADLKLKGKLEDSWGEGLIVTNCLEECENDMKAEIEWRKLTKKHLKGLLILVVLLVVMLLLSTRGGWGCNHKGFAQAKTPLSNKQTSSSRHEIKNIDPGFFAIGLARKDQAFYTRSIGYHKDDDNLQLKRKLEDCESDLKAEIKIITSYCFYWKYIVDVLLLSRIVRLFM